MKYQKAIVSCVYCTASSTGLKVEQETHELDLKDLEHNAPTRFNRMFSRTMSQWPAMTVPVMARAMKHELKKRGNLNEFRIEKFSTPSEWIYVMSGKVKPLVGTMDYFHGVIVLKN